MAREAGDRRAAADAALARVQDDPPGAVAAATALLAEARADGDAATASVALRTLGVARRDAGDLDEGERLLEEAAAVADAAGARHEAALARLSLVGLHAVAGRLAEGRAAAEAAAPHLDDFHRACLATQVAPLEEHAGRLRAALAAYDAAIPVFEAAGDGTWLSRARSNRAITLGYLGRLAEAERDLDRAEAIGPAGGVVTASLLLNRAWLAGLGADVPRALRLHDDAAEAAQAVGWPVGQTWRDQAELLAGVGLWEEAVEVAARAVDDLDRSLPLAAGEARLVLATALAGRGDAAGAAAAASDAAVGFRRQGRATWAARADLLAATTGSAGDAVGRALDAARTLADAGLGAEALEARAVAARLAVRAARPVPAAALPLVPPVGPPWVRARAWLAEALRRAAEGDPAGAVRAASAGLRAIEVLRASLGSVELRAGLAGVAAELADLLVASAAARGGPGSLLAAAERRVGAPVRSAAGDAAGEVGVALAALRAASGRAAGAGDGGEAAVALRAVADAEAEVRRLARAAEARRGAARPAPLDAVRDHLDRDAALVRFVVVGDDLRAVVVAAGARRARQVALGPVAAATSAAERLRAALARQAVRPGRAAGAVGLAAAELDVALLGPLRRPLAGAARLVVVPDGPLHAVAWGALPSLAGRPVATAPSAAAWLAALDRPDGPGRAVLVAGPGLDATAAEVEAAAVTWRAAGGEVVVRSGPAATVAAVRADLDGAAVAHLACHGRVRADAPPFSALELADGALTGFDLDLLADAPGVVVLAACDLGAGASVRGSIGGEVLGFPAWLLAAGTRAVVASLVPVPDATGAAAFGAVAAALAAGAGPAEAVVAASAAHPAVGAGLVCVGAG